MLGAEWLQLIYVFFFSEIQNLCSLSKKTTEKIFSIIYPAITSLPCMCIVPHCNYSFKYEGSLYSLLLEGGKSP